MDSALESEAESEFTPDRERDDCAAWVDEARGMAEGCRTGNVIVVVVSVVGSIGQIERLRNQL